MRPWLKSAIYLVTLSASVSVLNTDAFAWGERGHDLIARVAARLVAQRSSEPTLVAPFIAKEHMLGHLANVPDILFRDLPEAKGVEGPTHYFDSEYVFATPTVQGFPVAIADAVKMSEDHGKNLFDHVGTAPWRISQLFYLYVAALKSAKPADPAKPLSRAELEEAVNRALLYAGVMAHYVGDLSQPLHTTVDYDGWKKDQGGIHSYFEEAVVNAFPLSLDYEVFAAASKSILRPRSGPQYRRRTGRRRREIPFWLLQRLSPTVMRTSPNSSSSIGACASSNQVSLNP